MNTVVIGAVFMDIKGFPFSKYDAVGTNLGNVVLSHGGVARNVAENMAHLSGRSSFVTMLDRDALGSAVRAKLEDAEVDLSCAIEVPEQGMGMWLAVFNERNDLAGSISRMPNPKPLEAYFEKHGEEIIKNARDVVLEMDLSEPISEKVIELSEKYGKPVYAIVANMSIILQRPDLMARTTCVILNEIEAGRLFGEDLRTLEPDEMLIRVKENAQAMKLRAIIVTMSAKGAVFADLESGESGFCPSVPSVVVDTTGAGDSFFSAVVEALARGMTLKNAVKCGARLASRTIAISESVCPRVEEGFFDL